MGYHRYVTGQRNGPPEDCGGAPDFYDLLAARADPSDDNHADAVVWLGEYDPDAIEDHQVCARPDRR